MIFLLKALKKNVIKIRSKYYMASFRLQGILQRSFKIGKKVRLFVPIRCDGEGSVIIGNHNCFGTVLAPRAGSGEILIQARHKEAIVCIGNNNEFSNNISMIAVSKIAIGDNCRIGDFVSILDHDGHEIDPALRHKGSGKAAAINIGNNVWLGSRVVIQKGVAIGSNSIVAACSVVTKSIPPNCIAGGNPAKVIRYLSLSDGER